MKLKDFERMSEKQHGKNKDNKMLCVAQGLALLEQKLCEQKEPRFSVAAEHDEFFAAGPSPADVHWFDTELEMMVQWGWRWDDDVDSWAIFT